MMKKKYLGLICIATVFTFLLLGVHADLASAKDSTKPIIFKSAKQSSEKAWPEQHAWVPWLKGIEEATQGKLKFESYFSNSLCKTPEMWRAVETGIADHAQVPHTAYPGLTPLSDVVTLPFMPFKSSAQASGILWKLYEEFPSIRAEFEPHHVTHLVVGVCTQLLGKKLFKTIDDFKGVKIRPTGGIMAPKQLEMLGAAPIVMPGSEVYLNLQKGVIDAVVSQWDFTVGFRLYEGGHNFTYVPFNSFIISSIMNKKKYNSLPPDIRQKIDERGGLQTSAWFGEKEFDALYALAKERMNKEGIEMVEYTVPAEELEKWTSIAGKPIWDEWLKTNSSKGHPEAKQILERTLELIRTYNP
jgi:TRAP-type C4-dicarboxylate transport system substrate-binding protein